MLFKTEGAVCLTAVLPNSVPTWSTNLNHDRTEIVLIFHPIQNISVQNKLTGVTHH